MTFKRFREVRRGFVNNALGSGSPNTISVRLLGNAGLGLTTAGQSVVMMEVMLLGLYPNIASYAGCIIRRCVYSGVSASTSFNVHPEKDHRDMVGFSGINFKGLTNTTPFPIGATSFEPAPFTPGDPSSIGSFPFSFVNFSYSNPNAVVTYAMHSSANANTTKVHYQIAMEIFENNAP